MWNESKHGGKRAWGCQSITLTLHPSSHNELSMCWSAASVLFFPDLCRGAEHKPCSGCLGALQGSVMNHFPSTEGNYYYFTNTLFAIQESPGCFASPIEPIPTQISNCKLLPGISKEMLWSASNENDHWQFDWETIPCNLNDCVKPACLSVVIWKAPWKKKTWKRCPQKLQL